MIRLIQFGRKVARFPITPEIIAQIPNWEDLRLRYGNWKAEVCDVDWPYNHTLEEDEDYSELYQENWSQLYGQHIMNDADLATNAIIVVSRFLPNILESRRKYIEIYQGKPDVYRYVSNLLKLYCPIPVPGKKNKEVFHRWIVV